MALKIQKLNLTLCLNNALYAAAVLFSMNISQSEAFEVPVYVSKVEQREIKKILQFPGRIISDNAINLAAQVSGKLTHVLPLGATVQKGEIIAQIDNTLFEIEHQKAKQAIINIKAEQKLTQNEWKRVSELANNNYASDSLIDELATKLQLITGQLNQAQLDLAYKAFLLERTQIKAPFDGVITERLKKAGEWIETSNEVVSLIDTEQLEVSLTVPSDFAARLDKKKLATVISDNGIYQGKLRAKVPQKNFKFYELRVTLNDQTLTPGLAVNVGFVQQGLSSNHIAVPRDALQVRNGTLGVFRVNAENMSEYISVKPLAIENGWSAIEGELKPDDTIVIRGVERLSHGQSVKVIKH